MQSDNSKSSEISNQSLSDFEKFINWLTYEKRASPHTISNYRRDLEKLFQDFPDYQKISEQDIRKFTAKKHSQGITSSSLSRHLSAIRAFYNYLNYYCNFNKNPVTNVHPPKGKKELPKTLNPDQINQILKFPLKKPEDYRDLAIFELIYSSGLRLSELVAINDSDLPDIKNGKLIVLGKRQKTREIPVGNKAIIAINNWLKFRDQLTTSKKTINSDNKIKPLFINKSGKRLTGRTIEYRLTKIAKKTGIQFKVHPHMLRHSFASHLLQSSGDLRAVQELLGHSSISSTQIYTHLDFNNLAKIYDRTHPRAKI